jgi:hypothetical protein
MYVYCVFLEMSIDINITRSLTFIQFVGLVYEQMMGIPMGTNRAEFRWRDALGCSTSEPLPIHNQRKMEEYFKQNSVKPIRYPPSVRSADVCSSVSWDSCFVYMLEENLLRHDEK